MAFTIHRLASGDVALCRALNALFGAAFDDAEHYGAKPPADAYFEALLRKEHVIPLVALSDGEAIGGLVAYELEKFEQQRSEIYIYDLAVAEAHRRQGVATALIRYLGDIASSRGAWVIYVQADYGDEPAIALYTKLGRREDVMHFDIDVETKP
ncbi:MAG: AAC(3)-I family aminoglycoside 3-N-acetyltransferase [Proteobacteria bacterium HN_bin10]|nr:MAG: AAC(3)-I family aminoglycoside 3-N-acetyltransferase [Proteobacteria bacterium HN_bin10]